MTILQALNGFYERLAARGETDPPGYTREKISFAVELTAEGAPIGVVDLREGSGKGLRPRVMAVPAAVTRSQKILPNLLWDKSSYSLGQTALSRRRLPEQHEAFKQANLALIGDAQDAGLRALRRFIETWTPDQFSAAPFTPEMLDANIVFKLTGVESFIHESPAAQDIVSRLTEEGTPAVCLVTGRSTVPRRLHPTIKGIEGALTTGATLVSFNLGASSSFDKQQGDNAPVSPAAAARYGAALNRLLEATGRNRLRRAVGDTTVLFWAAVSGAACGSVEAENVAAAAEHFFATVFEPPTDAEGAGKARDFIRLLPDGRSPGALHQIGLQADIRFHVLGLSPNAARLSVRYWVSDDFAVIMRRLGEHFADLHIEPSPWRTPPAVEFLLGRSTALLESADNVQPHLAGEVVRAVLLGTPYPKTLLSAAISRLRNGGDPSTGWHAAVIKAVLARDQRLKRVNSAAGADGDSACDPPVALDKENSSVAYQLGRYLASLEAAQRMALGNTATVRECHFPAASAAPALIFPALQRGLRNNLTKLRRQRRGSWLQQEIDEISGRLPLILPRALRLEQQGLFVLGYYHQRRNQFAGMTAGDLEEDLNAD